MKAHPKEQEALFQTIEKVIDLRDDARRKGDILLVLIFTRHLGELQKRFNRCGGARRIRIV